MNVNKGSSRVVDDNYGQFSSFMKEFVKNKFIMRKYDGERVQCLTRAYKHGVSV